MKQVLGKTRIEGIQGTGGGGEGGVSSPSGAGLGVRLTAARDE